MLRRLMLMATAQKSKGRMMERISISNGGNRGQANGGQANGGNRGQAMNKPPTGRILPVCTQSETSLVADFSNLSLKDSSKNSAASVFQQQRRPYTASRRPVVIKNIDDVATLLRDHYVKNVVIVAGAGISTPSGIPDFRSPGTGLYDNLQQYSIPYAEAIFDIDFFHHNPRPFFTLAKELYPMGKYRPNYLHYFARLLHDKGLLLRMYTQNIDGLERIAGIPEEKMVEAHGTFSTATCTTCRGKYNGDEIKEKILQDKIPRCEKASCRGIIKPDIVFFGEELPKRFYFYLKDMLQTDLVIIMGTSLEVQPFAGIIDTVRFTVPRLLLNRVPVGPFRRHKRPQDFVAAGDLISELQKFVALLGWHEEMVSLITRKEGLFKLAFPPPVQLTGDKKSLPPVKPDPLSRMWRQNAQFSFYSDSDTSDSDSAVTPSDSDTSTDSEMEARPRLRRPGAVQHRDRVAGRGDADSGKGSSVISSSSSVSNTSGSTDGVGNKLDKERLSRGQNSGGADSSGALLNRRKNGNSHGSTRLFSHQAVVPPTGNVGKGKSLPASPNEAERRIVWAKTVRQKPPPVPASSYKSDVGAARLVGANKQISRLPPPGTHAAKPRSNSVTKAVPEKAHTKASDSFKMLYPRLKSAETVKIAYRHRLQPTSPYDARILSLQAGASDSSSSSDDIPDNEDDSDDSSDDLR